MDTEIEDIRLILPGKIISIGKQEFQVQAMSYDSPDIFTHVLLAVDDIDRSDLTKINIGSEVKFVSGYRSGPSSHKE